MVPKITDSLIRQHCTAESFQRGEDYYANGAVGSIIRRGDQLQAEVEGSQFEPYQVQIDLDEAGVRAVSCSCPYSYDGWCKHIVAVLLAVAEPSTSIEERRPIAELLAPLSAEQLRTLLHKLADQDPSLVAAIENQVSLLQQKPAPAAVAEAPAPKRRTAIDAKDIQRQVRSALHGGDYRYSSRDYQEYFGNIFGGLHSILKMAADYVESGDYQAALDVLEALTDEYVRGQETLMDEDGYASAFFDDIEQVWIAVLLSAELSEEEREQWSARLDDWAAEVEQYGMDDALWSASAAATQGWDEPHVQRVLQGDLSAVADAPEIFDEKLTTARLAILERNGRHEEYLNLARATGHASEAAAVLLNLGRIAEAVRCGLTAFRSASEAFTLAKALRERGELDLALQFGEHGLTLDRPRAPLASWLCDLASGLGQTERALTAAVVAFDDAPDLATYQRVEQLAGERWPAYRERALESLRKRQSYDLRGTVDIFLHEGLIDDAIAAVRGYAGYDVLEQVVRAAIDSRPDWVIQACRRQAEPIMNEARAKYYENAARWLGYARKAYLASGRTSEWRTYIGELVAAHARKYKLRPLLEELQTGS